MKTSNSHKEMFANYGHDLGRFIAENLDEILKAKTEPFTNHYVYLCDDGRILINRRDHDTDALVENFGGCYMSEKEALNELKELCEGATWLDGYPKAFPWQRDVSDFLTR